MRGIMVGDAAQRAHHHGDVHGRLEAFAGHVADDDQQAAVGRGFDMVEIAADLVGRSVDGIDLESGSFDLFLGDHQLLHAARGGQLAGGVLLLALDAQEADKR